MNRGRGAREAEREVIRRVLRELFPEWSGQIPVLPPPVTVELKSGKKPLDLLLDRRREEGRPRPHA